MDDDDIKSEFETMDDEALLVVKKKLEALNYDDIEDDAVPVWKSGVDMCNEVIADRTMAVVHHKVAAVVSGHNHAEYLPVRKRVDIITSIIEEGCKALLRPSYGTRTLGVMRRNYGEMTMAFEEFVDAEEYESGYCFVTKGYSPYYHGYEMRHCIRIKTSPAGTAIKVDSHVSAAWAAACPGDGKKAKKLSIANLQAIVAAATEGATLTGPPGRKEQ